VAVIEDGVLSEIHVESARERRIVGNIYKARVMRVLPGMNAAFVDAGLERTGFLYAYDVASQRAPDEEQFEEDAPQEKPDRPERFDLQIASLVREGQEILVQVSKEPIGSKGARLTCNFAIPGVLVVLLPNVEHVGISRKIDEPEERQRLKELGERVRPPGSGVIMRTVAEGRSPEEIRNEVDFLHKLWLQITQGAEAVAPPVLLHEDMSLLMRTARDMVCRKFERLIVDCETAARQVEGFIRRFVPSSAQRVEVYQGTQPLFERFNVEYELTRAVQRKVWLKSGGHIVIDRVEAFTAIDVNSGKFTGGSDPEETILKLNLEAVQEIAYQLRLRNIGGIIVIDFVDLRNREKRQLVYETLVRECEQDYARTRILPMSDLGLIEMTRKRVAESIVKKLTEPCFYCEGKGYLKSPEMISHALFAKIRKEAGACGATRVIHAHANPRIIESLMEHYETALEKLEKETRTSIVLTQREGFHLEQVEVFGETE